MSKVMHVQGDPELKAGVTPVKTQVGVKAGLHSVPKVQTKKDNKSGFKVTGKEMSNAGTAK